MNEIEELVSELIKTYEVTSGSEILFPSANPTVGKCPRCGNIVLNRNKGYLCANPDCNFALWKNNRFFTAKKIPLTPEIVSELLDQGFTYLSGCHSSKTGKLYNAVAVMDEEDGRTIFRLEFPDDE